MWNVLTCGNCGVRLTVPFILLKECVIYLRTPAFLPIILQLEFTGLWFWIVTTVAGPKSIPMNGYGGAMPLYP